MVRDRPMSRDRSGSEIIDIVEEIQEKLASLARRVTRVSRDRSTSQVVDDAIESGGFRG